MILKDPIGLKLSSTRITLNELLFPVRLVSDVVHYFSGKDKQNLKYDIDDIVLGKDKRSFTNPYYDGKSKKEEIKLEDIGYFKRF